MVSARLHHTDFIQTSQRSMAALTLFHSCPTIVLVASRQTTTSWHHPSNNITTHFAAYHCLALLRKFIAFLWRNPNNQNHQWRLHRSWWPEVSSWHSRKFVLSGSTWYIVISGSCVLFLLMWMSGARWPFWPCWPGTPGRNLWTLTNTWV